MLKSFRYLFHCLSFLICISVSAQAPKKYTASEIQMAIKKLNVTGSVLYIAAHPDDENTRLISWLANDKLVNTAYLSLTRGDGGQNLIGLELNEQLGLIRTQELLMARRIDGGKQYFSRARDFGFSKNPDETFSIWNREQVLEDMVWIIRNYRPDVIITRFNTIPGTTHGHHTASAILAQEAFTAAADKNRFPDQLRFVETWQPKRLLWNTNAFFFANAKDFKTDSLIKVDVGEYNPYLGKSYTEIAAESRSQHKSQGFGSAGTRGENIEYLKPELGPWPRTDMFDGVDLTWNRVQGGAAISAALQDAYNKFNPADPAASVDALLRAKTALDALPESHLKRLKLEELQEVIKACAGLYVETVAADNSASPGETIKLTVELTNRSSLPIEVKKISFTGVGKDSSFTMSLQRNISNVINTSVTLPADIPHSQPYWLKEKGTVGMFTVNDRKMILVPENPPAVSALYTVVIKGQTFTFSSPVIFKKTDPVKGELYSPFVVTPPVFLNITDNLYVFADKDPKTVSVKVIAGKKDVVGEVALQLPKGWKAVPAFTPFSLKSKGQEQTFEFKVTPGEDYITDSIHAVANVGGKTYDKGLVNIQYDHIPAQMLFPEATVRVLRLDLKKKGKNIGYVMGAGDEVPAALEQIGYKVTMLKEENLQTGHLQNYDAIVIGIRAYNTIDKLKARKHALMDYVKRGGTLVVQYNTVGRNPAQNAAMDSIGPYTFKLSNDRVTEENAEMRVLKPEHPVMNKPNKITAKDFEGWVQERGLYYPSQWSKEYEAIFSANDRGETPKSGGLLIAQYGKGYYVYTGLSWFRELPSGVPGAYRLFTNIISLGK